MFDNTYLRFRALLLWNLDYSNRVVYSRTEDKAKWFETMVREEVDFVIVGKDMESHKWMQENPERFELLEDDKFFAFYLVRLKPPWEDSSH